MSESVAALCFTIPGGRASPAGLAAAVTPVVAHEVATLEGILSCILAPWLPISWSWLTWRWWCGDCCSTVRGGSLVGVGGAAPH